MHGVMGSLIGEKLRAGELKCGQMPSSHPDTENGGIRQHSNRVSVRISKYVGCRYPTSVHIRTSDIGGSGSVPKLRSKGWAPMTNRRSQAGDEDLV